MQRISMINTGFSSVPTCCLVSLPGRCFFQGARVADSMLFSYKLVDATTSDAPAIGEPLTKRQRTSSALALDDLDDELAAAYGVTPVSRAPAANGNGNDSGGGASGESGGGVPTPTEGGDDGDDSEDEGAASLEAGLTRVKEVAKLPCFGPMGDFCMGRGIPPEDEEVRLRCRPHVVLCCVPALRVSAHTDPNVVHTQSYSAARAYTMVSTAGSGKEGVVCFFTRGLQPQVAQQIETDGCRGVWGVRYTGDNAVPEQPADGEGSGDAAAPASVGPGAGADASAAAAVDGDEAMLPADGSAAASGEAGSADAAPATGEGGEGDTGEDGGEDDEGEDEEDDEEDESSYLFISAETSTTVLAMHGGQLSQLDGEVRVFVGVLCV